MMAILNALQAKIRDRDIRIQELEGRLDCSEGIASKDTNPGYVRGYAYQYEKEQKNIAKVMEAF